MALHLWPHMEHIRYRRSLPRLPLPVDGDDVSVVLAMVAAFGVVRLVAQAQRDPRRASADTPDGFYFSAVCSATISKSALLARHRTSGGLRTRRVNSLIGQYALK